MLKKLCFYAVLYTVFAVSLDAFHVGMLLSTTTTTHGFHQAPITLVPKRLMARRALYCFSMQSVSVIVPISVNCLIVICCANFIPCF